MPPWVAAAADTGTPARSTSRAAKAGAAGLSAAVACLAAVHVAHAADDLAWDRAKEFGAVSVRERPRTAYEPDGIRIGNYLMLPEIGFRTSFTEDSAGGRSRDIKYDLTTALEMRSMLPRHLLDFRLEGRATAHHDTEELRYIDGKAKVIGRFDIDHATALFGNISSELAHEENVDDERPSGITRPPVVAINRAEAGLRRTMGRIDAAVGARYTRFDYQAAETNDGQKIPQDFRNYSVVEPFAMVGYRFSPGYRVFAEVSGSRVDNAGDGTVDRDAVGLQAGAGVEFELSPLVKVMLKGGHFQQDYRQPGLTDIATSVYEARLDWYVSPLVSLTFNTRRNVYATSFGEASGRIVTSYAVKADYEMWRNLIVSGEATLKLADYIGEDRNDRIWIGRIGVDYMASKHWLFTVGYEHQELVSSDSDFDRRFDRVMVGAKYRF
ncbi:MAG: outer membrane beta-barrel protein [Hyphomicrobiaceae bacterium]